MMILVDVERNRKKKLMHLEVSIGRFGETWLCLLLVQGKVSCQIIPVSSLIVALVTPIWEKDVQSDLEPTSCLLHVYL